MPISTVPGSIVQYGHVTVGPNVWVTDAPACGSIKLKAVDYEFCTSYTMPSTCGSTESYRFRVTATPFNTSTTCTAPNQNGISEPLIVNLSCPVEDFDITINGVTGPVAQCPGDEVTLCLTGNNLPVNGTATWQVSTNGGTSYSNIGSQPIALTFNPAANWLGYMNVFNLPSQGGGYIFGSPWGTNDLVATITGSELCLQPNQIGDPNPFWYTPSGGPGSTGNKFMEANHYLENNTGLYAGQNLSYSVEVTSNTFSCGHTTRLYIREFGPNFSFIINETFVTLGEPGVYTVTMPISTVPGSIVQYGHVTTGPNVWVTDAPACGSIKLKPVDAYCTKYTIPANGSSMVYAFRVKIDPFNVLGCTSANPADVDGFSDPIFAVVNTGITMACNDHLNISVSDNCSFVPNAGMFLEGEPSNYGAFPAGPFLDQFFGVSFYYNNQKVELNQVGNYLNKVLKYSIVDRCTGATAAGAHLQWKTSWHRVSIVVQ